jgi:hypothetical protein
MDLTFVAICSFVLGTVAETPTCSEPAVLTVSNQDEVDAFLSNACPSVLALEVRGTVTDLTPLASLSQVVGATATGFSVSSVQAHKLIQIHTNTDSCLPLSALES